MKMLSATVGGLGVLALIESLVGSFWDIRHDGSECGRVSSGGVHIVSAGTGGDGLWPLLLLRQLHDTNGDKDVG